VDKNSEYIIGYLEGTLDKEKQIFFHELLSTSPEFKKEFDDLSFIWQASAELKLHDKVDTSRNWNKLSSRIKRQALVISILHLARNAAAILLFPTLIATYTLFTTINEWDNVPVGMTEVSAVPGIISKVTLPDGSEVWLNSGSTLSYPVRFTKNKREVSLNGEAYFKVVSDKTNRFEVVAGDEAFVSAYGTEFNVKAYDDESMIKATLVEGNIEVFKASSTQKHKVTPGEQLIFDKEKSLFEKKEVNLAVVTGWKDGKMIFRRADMAEIIRRLSRKFNVDIQLEGEELYNYEYSATFTNESLNEILYLLEKSAPIRCRIIEPEQTADYSYSKRTVVISILDKK